ncbi:MAG: thiamine pyrophosphate-binding protein [Gammaproteobacteria bacterium]|nr:thiamine pyrophosphate-binding protein [Gammaproteobacteria bacterium]
MSNLVKRYLDAELSRRDFANALLTAGLSSSAVGSLVAMVSEARADAHAQPRGTRFTGMGAEVIVETLLAADVEYLFATTATGMTSLFDALALRTGPEFILALHEGQATSMAHGYELASGKTAALFLPGVAVPNALNNLYNAWKDRSAIAVFSDGPRNNLRGREQFQQIDDWLAPTAQFTKWRWEVQNAKMLGEMTRRALKMAGTPPGGPVHIRFPQNLLAQAKVSDTIYPQSLFRVNVNLPPRADVIEQAARLLIEAERPMINVGHEVTRAGANAEVLQLAEMLGATVYQGFSVYGDMDFNHPLFGGFYGMGFPPGVGKMDTFLNIGSPMPSPAAITTPVPRKAKVIHARMEYEDIGRFHPTDVGIAGGIKETTTALIDAINSMATQKRLKQISEPRMAAARENFAKLRETRREAAEPNWNASPMSWERIGYELDQELADDAVVVSELDSRIPYQWLNFKQGHKRLIGQTTGFALGWGVGASFGVKTALPDRQVVCLVGDGAFLFGQAEALWTAARCEIPVTVVIFNNESYDGERERIYMLSPLARDKERKHLWKDMTCYLGNPLVDFVGLAKSFGIDGRKAEKADEFKDALRRARRANEAGEPYLVDLKIMQKGHGANENWHPPISIADKRSIKI